MSNQARIRPHLRIGQLAAVMAFVLAMAGMTLSAPTAEAGKGWCRVDPVFIIDGQVADVFIGSELSALLTTTGPIKITVTVPRGINVTHVLSDLGFGKGYKITVVKSASLKATKTSVPVNIDVYVPAKSNLLPVSVFFSPRLLGILSPASADGAANQWVSLQSHL